mgnify:CR=1 FL=1
MFRTLELSDVERIIELELQGLFERTRRLGYKVKITDGAKRRLAAATPQMKTNVDALIGRSAVTITPVDSEGGRVRPGR